jgi:hypothetical protein
MIDDQLALVAQHFEDVWRVRGSECPLLGPPDRLTDLGQHFRVLEFAPGPEHDMWGYATCGMGFGIPSPPLELFIHSRRQSPGLADLLTLVAHYHRTAKHLWYGHTVNFGRPWLPSSRCEYGLLSLPYLDGAALEVLKGPGPVGEVRFSWLVPITKEERDFKSEIGLDELERRFEHARFDYLDPRRASVV